MNYNWDWGIFLAAEPGGTGTYLKYLVVGLGWTLATALAAWVIALAIGSVVGTLRTTPYKWVVRLGNAYVEVFRNVPLIVQMFLWFFVVPELLPKGLGDWIKQMPPPWGSYLPAVMCLGLYTSVRIAEQVKSGIGSLSRGQGMAGTALGLTLAQNYRFVLLPQAFRIVLPPLTSEFMNVIKNSSVALTIGLLELTGRARAMQEFSFKVFEAFAAATVIYLLTNLVVAGEIPLALTVYNYRVDQIKASGAPIEWIIIPPTIARFQGMGLARRAPHPHAAVLYFDFMLTDGQEILLKRGFIPTSRSISTPLNQFPMKLLDPTLALDEHDKWSKLFKEIVLNPSR